MTIGQLLAFNITLLFAIASPGPALLMAIRTTLSAGRTAGIAVGAGLGLMAATWTMMALLGLGAIFQLFPIVYLGAKIVGAAYLLYIAYKLWQGSTTSVDTHPKPARRAFIQGFLINLLNPKSVLFAAAVLITVFPAGMSLANSLVIVVNHFLVEVAFYTALSFGMSAKAVADRYMKAKVHIDRGAAAILGVLGCRLLLSRGDAP